MFAVTAIPTSANSLFAADYTVELGIDSRAGKDAGTVECVLDVLCTMQLQPFGLRVSVYVPSRVRDTASVSMYGDEADCCYFDGASPSIVIVPGASCRDCQSFVAGEPREPSSFRTNTLEFSIFDSIDTDSTSNRQGSARGSTDLPLEIISINHN